MAIQVPHIRYLALVALLGAQACSSSNDDDEDVSEQAEVDWSHPACDTAALAPPGGDALKCNGPWSFNYNELWTDRDACGEDATRACEAFSACASWDKDVVGDGLGVRQEDSTPPTQTGFSQGCTPKKCFQPAPLDQCISAAKKVRDDMVKTISAGVPGWALNQFTVTGTPQGTGTSGPDPETGAITTFFNCNFAAKKFPKQETDARPACGCAHYPAATCTRFTGTTLTSPEQTKPTSPGSPTFPGDTRVFASAPTCTTCDQLPSDTDAAAQAKFACFDQNLSAASGGLRSSLVARMKLLFQLSGERLTPAQRTRVEALYDTETGSPACSVAVAWDASCQPAAADAHVSTQLQLCADLVSNASTSKAMAAAELAHCTSQLGGLAGLGDTCRIAMRDPAAATVQSLLKTAQPSFAGDFAAALPLALSRIGAWWSGASALAAGDQQWFGGQSGALLRWLWSTIEAQRMPLPQVDPTTDAQAASLLADIDSSRFTNDVAVLAAAFGPGQGSSSPPLLTLTGDSLQALADRLRRLEPIHDVGCRFALCKTDTALRVSATSELVRALATLPDAPAFSAAVQAATHLQQQRPDLHAALAKIRNQHVYLETAWSLLGRREPFSDLATIADPPPEVERLAAMVRDAALAWASYQASGEFAPWNRPRLTAATLRQDDLVGFIDSSLVVAASANTDYTNARLATLNTLLDQARTGAAEQSQIDLVTELRAHAQPLCVDR